MDKSLMLRREPILMDEVKDTDLSEKGFTIFPLLDEKAITALKEYYLAFQQEEPKHFYSSTHAVNKDFRKRTSDFIKEVISPVLDEHFKNYRLLGGAFVVKPAEGKGLLPPHQDWNLVDETAARSYNIWIPLTDVTFENGAVCVLPGSHKKMVTFRGPGIPSLFKDIDALVWQNLEVLPMKAGETLFYDHALLHASPLNTTKEIRLGIVCGMISKQSNMRLYFAQAERVAAYAIDENFFMDKDPAKGPEGLSFLEAGEKQHSISAAEFKANFLNQKKKLSWFSTFFRNTRG